MSKQLIHCEQQVSPQDERTSVETRTDPVAITASIIDEFKSLIKYNKKRQKLIMKAATGQHAVNMQLILQDIRAKNWYSST